MKIIVEDLDSVSDCGPAIFAVEPHHILPLSIIGFNNVVSGIPGHDFLGCVTSSCFYLPLIKHVYTWTFATSVAKDNLHHLLDIGYSPVLCPGGVKELWYLPSYPGSSLTLANVANGEEKSSPADPNHEIVLYHWLPATRLAS